MPGNLQSVLAPAGSAGNQTSAALLLDPDSERANVEFVVEAIGATPTVTWKAQVSMDGLAWFDAQYVTDAVDTVAVAAITVTVVGSQVVFLRLADRGWQWVRLVVSANTNVTYRCELRQKDVD